MPLLGPGAETRRLLTRMPLARLRAAAVERGLAPPSRATRDHIANLLVQHTMRAQAEAQYRDTGIAFDSREAAYPHIRRMVTRHRLRRILDVGCGPGLFAEELRRSRALPADGSYAGIDVSPAAVELARKRFAEDPRFVFHVGDADHVDAQPAMEIDGIVISFVLSYLDTHSAHRLLKTLSTTYPDAILVVALTFTSCVDRLDGVEPDGDRELRAARRFIAGDTSIAAGLWDVRRLQCYRQSMETYYRIRDERTLSPLAQMLWVAAPL